MKRRSLLRSLAEAPLALLGSRRADAKPDVFDAQDETFNAMVRDLRDPPKLASILVRVEEGDFVPDFWPPFGHPKTCYYRLPNEDEPLDARIREAVQHFFTTGTVPCLEQPIQMRLYKKDGPWGTDEAKAPSDDVCSAETVFVGSHWEVFRIAIRKRRTHALSKYNLTPYEFDSRWGGSKHDWTSWPDSEMDHVEILKPYWYEDLDMIHLLIWYRGGHG